MGIADLRYESSFVGFLKPRPKLTFGWVQDCHFQNYPTTSELSAKFALE
jgi:hypothetical protein